MKKKILVTDDTEDILLNLQEYLVMEGFEVAIARNGKEALLQVQLDLPDLIITDLLMSQMTGYELIKELKRNKAFSEIPVIVFSAKPHIESKEIIELGANRFVLKPSSPEVILGHIVGLLSIG